MKSQAQADEAYSEDRTLRIELKRELTSFGNEHTYLGEHEGELIDSESGVHAGRSRVFIVDLEGAEEVGLGALDVLDLDGATEPYLSLIGHEAGNFSPAVMRLLNEEFAYSRNMLIIDRVELLPFYRGRGLGLQCMRTFLRHMSMGCRIAAIKPYPLQFEAGAARSENWSDGLQLSSLTKSKRSALQRLKSHYSQLGFQHVRGTDLMILDLHARPLPGGIHDSDFV